MAKVVWDVIEDRFNPSDFDPKVAKSISTPDRGKALLIPFITTAINALVDVASDPKAYGPARVAAANSILDRVYGRAEAIDAPPPPPIEGTGVLLIPQMDREEWLNRT